MMKTIKPVLPIKSVIFWIIIVGLFFLFSDNNSLLTYALTFLPVHFLFLIVRHFTNKIVISDNILSARINFDKIQIDLDKVRSFEVKKKNLAIQIIFGIPKEVIQVEYNKYDTIQLNSVDPILLEALNKNLSKE